MYTMYICSAGMVGSKVWRQIILRKIHSHGYQGNRILSNSVALFEVTSCIMLCKFNLLTIIHKQLSLYVRMYFYVHTYVLLCTYVCMYVYVPDMLWDMEGNTTPW